MHFGLKILTTLVAISLCLLAAAALAGATPVAAHPLGNFTINHYDRITVSGTGIEVYTVLDMAEIPAFRERGQIDANGDGIIDAAETETYASQKADELRRNLMLNVDRHDLPLSLLSYALTFPEGQAGLSLLRLTATYAAPVSASRDAQQVSFENHNYDDRLGWREIIITSGANVRISGASAPAQDISAELTAYPQDALSSPLDVRSASFSFVAAPGTAADVAPNPRPETAAVRGNPDSPLARFAGLVAKEHLSAGVIVLALLAAAGFGAIHALSPGHGKTIVAAYLVGSRGTARHALALGLTVTITHTSSVYALGFAALYLSEYIVPERLYPWLTLASGALIVGMGLALLVGRARSSGLLENAGAWLNARRQFDRAPGTPIRMAFASTRAASAGRSDAVVETDRTPPSHNASSAHHDAQEHDRAGGGAHSQGQADARQAPEHRHGLGRPHSHGVASTDGEPVTWRRLLGLGIFGGLLPCPSAIVVMLSAISLHRVGFGLILIVAFSLGLAGVLTGIGFALVYGHQIVRRVPVLNSLAGANRPANPAVSLAVRAFPVASAAAVFVAGFVVMYPAFGKL
ncbi:MAG: sulfite exporter TauE/SafE family protein [Chloroflexota bacterium]|nr:sulfite exporter TauE/SafE family protein [Chloroflexota bacterium]